MTDPDADIIIAPPLGAVFDINNDDDIVCVPTARPIAPPFDSAELDRNTHPL